MLIEPIYFTEGLFPEMIRLCHRGASEGVLPRWPVGGVTGRYPMDARIQVSGSDEAGQFTNLWTWLRGERALAGTVRAEQRPPGAGELGGVYDMLTVAVGSGGAGVALARSLTAWLQTRRSDVVITVTSPSGNVQLDARRIKDTGVLPLLEEVLRERDER